MRKIVSTLPDDSGNPAKIFALAIDVTEGRRAAEAIAASEQRLKYIMAATGEGMWDWPVTTDILSQ